ncbi:PASTA domain-containing protein [Streptomyces sp. NPDC050145]|uniref:PASTA domain-containing protein n=1 Tax=Streptomyces sp. NPDC050145 TaxID=3365602 RepID=UPI00378A447F
MRLGTLGSGIALATAMVALSAGCSSPLSDGPSSAEPSASTPARLRPDSLSAKIGTEVEKGFGYSVRDATDAGRTVDMRHVDLWRFCLESKGGQPKTVDLGAVPYGEKCPDHWDAHIPEIRTPRVTGKKFENAYQSLLEKGYDSLSIDVLYGSEGVVEQADMPRVDGEVCKQSPKPGAPFDPSENVKLYVAMGNCPKR